MSSEGKHTGSHVEQLMKKNPETETVHPGYVAESDRDVDGNESGDSTSLELLMQAQEGRTSAIEVLFSRLLPDMTAWARGKLPGWARSRADTDDLVQDAFRALYRRRHQFDPRRNRAIRAYLRQAIRNRIRDEVRRANKVEVQGEAGLDTVSPDTSPLEHAISAQNTARYRMALRRLNEVERDLVVGRIELDYSNEQLALVTGKPSADAARMALRRAFVRLAEAMDLERP